MSGMEAPKRSFSRSSNEMLLVSNRLIWRSQFVTEPKVDMVERTDGRKTHWL